MDYRKLQSEITVLYDDVEHYKTSTDLTIEYDLNRRRIILKNELDKMSSETLGHPWLNSILSKRIEFKTETKNEKRGNL